MALAAMDIHKRVLMVAVATPLESFTQKADGKDAESEKIEYECRRFGAGTQERQHLKAWMEARGVTDVVMESTAQYWKPVWLDLEPHFRLHLAQAHSNRAPKGRKFDFRDTKRLARRHLASELILSYVPGAEQRQWRMLTRSKGQLVRDRVRLQNQMEALLEEMRIKLSSVVSDLLGASGRRILKALAEGKQSPAEMADLGDDRLRCSKQELADALSGPVDATHRKLLSMDLERLHLLDRQIADLDQMVADAMQSHADAVKRVAQTPGFGVDSAQQLIAEVGVDAKAFPTAGQFASWVGTTPGSEESAEKNHSSHSPKGNRFLRRIFTQAAQAAVKKKGCHFQSVFHRMKPKLGYKGAIWAIAHRLCRLIWKILHDGISYIEQGMETNPKAKKRRAQKLAQALRQLGYTVTLAPINTEAPETSPSL